MSQQDVSASPAQLRYADILYYGALLGFVAMIITYALYVFQILEPQIPLDKLVAIWGQNAANYRAEGGIPQGWGWVLLLHKGDMINFIGIVILAGLTIVCFVRLFFDFLKTKEYLMATLSILEVIVLCVAASGIFGTGGH